MKDNAELRQIFADCFLHTKTFCKVFFPDRFTRPFAGITDEIFNVLDDDNIQQAVIVAPRGWGKTSIVNMAFPAKRILFKQSNFIVPISCTATQAILQSENLKRKLLYSDRVRKFCEPLKSEVFAKDLWMTSNGVMVLPRGSGQQVRGFLSEDSRPDLILVDDLEDKEGVMNEDQRKKTKEWFFSDVCNSIDRSSDKWRIIVIGTILHEDSLLANLMVDPAWTKIELELCDDNYHSNWPEFMTDDQIRKLKEDHAARGMLDLFSMEYQNKVIPPDAPFKEFKYYEPSKVSRDTEWVIIVDPAKTTNPTSAYSGIIAAGFDGAKPAIYIDVVCNERIHPNELYDKAFEACKQYRARPLGVEVTGLDEFITYPIQNEIIRRRLNIELIPLRARGGANAESKTKRARALIPLFRQGVLYLNKATCAPLEAQMRAFPRCKYWDLIDPTAYIVEMFDLGERYFSASDSDVADDYDYDYDEELVVNLPQWRII